MAISKYIDETCPYNKKSEISRKLEGFCRVIKIIFIGKYVRYKTLLKM